jgi:hypothetical protein
VVTFLYKEKKNLGGKNTKRSNSLGVKVFCHIAIRQWA